jgi:hypothetical protein
MSTTTSFASPLHRSSGRPPGAATCDWKNSKFSVTRRERSFGRQGFCIDERERVLVGLRQQQLEVPLAALLQG